MGTKPAMLLLGLVLGSSGCCSRKSHGHEPCGPQNGHRRGGVWLTSKLFSSHALLSPAVAFSRRTSTLGANFSRWLHLPSVLLSVLLAPALALTPHTCACSRHPEHESSAVRCGVCSRTFGHTMSPQSDSDGGESHDSGRLSNRRMFRRTGISPSPLSAQRR